VHEPGEPPRPDELPGKTPDELPGHGPSVPHTPNPATDGPPLERLIPPQRTLNGGNQAPRLAERLSTPKKTAPGVHDDGAFDSRDKPKRHRSGEACSDQGNRVDTHGINRNGCERIEIA
jgi:hypothetical protein